MGASAKPTVVRIYERLKNGPVIGVETLKTTPNVNRLLLVEEDVPVIIDGVPHVPVFQPGDSGQIVIVKDVDLASLIRVEFSIGHVIVRGEKCPCSLGGKKILARIITDGEICLGCELTTPDGVWA